MKSNTLANVLIKILGLYLCVNAFPNFVAGILAGVISLEIDATSKIISRTWSLAGGSAMQALIGLVFIIKSWSIAQWLFRNENE